MTWFQVNNLDYIATKLQGMAIWFMDNGDYNTAKELQNMVQELKDISKELFEDERSMKKGSVTENKEDI